MNSEVLSPVPEDNYLGPWVKYLSSGVDKISRLEGLNERIKQVYHPESPRPAILFATLGEILTLNPPTDEHVYKFAEEDDWIFNTTELLEAQTLALFATGDSLISCRTVTNPSFKSFLMPALSEVIRKDVMNLSKNNQDKAERSRYWALAAISHLVYFGDYGSMQSIRQDKELGMSVALVATRGLVKPDLANWAGAANMVASHLLKRLHNGQV